MPAADPLQLLLFAVTILGALGYVLWPPLRANLVDGGWDAAPPVVLSQEALALEERRDAALRAIRDLDADYEAGRIDEADYRADREVAVAEAARCLQQAEQAGAKEIVL